MIVFNQTNLKKVVSGPRVVKVQSSVKKRCIRCKIVRRRGIVRVICSANPRHKQRQGPIRGSSSRFKGKRSKGKG